MKIFTFLFKLLMAGCLIGSGAILMWAVVDIETSKKEQKEYMENHRINAFVFTVMTSDQVLAEVTVAIRGRIISSREIEIKLIARNVLAEFPSSNQVEAAIEIERKIAEHRIPIVSASIRLPQNMLVCDETGCNYPDIPVDLP